jgi:hypothetical protein
MFRYFFWTTLFLILSVGVFGFTLTQLDPIGSQQILALSLFLISFVGTVWTILTYICFFGVELITGKKSSEKNFQQSLRRGGLVALFCTVLLVLRLFNLLGWTEGILFGIFLLLVELIFSMDSGKLPAK